MLLLCHSLIDTNTIPFYFSTVSDRKSRSTHSAVRTYRIISSVSFLILRVIYPRAPYRPSVSPCRLGRSSPSTSLMPQLVQAVILPQHGASADSKGSGNFLRISSVLPTSLHIRRDVFVEIDPPAGLSSIHSPTLGRV